MYQSVVDLAAVEFLDVSAVDIIIMSLSVYYVDQPVVSVTRGF